MKESKNKVIDEKFASIVDSLCFWLGYQFKIGRERLIHEASLRYPIADTITSKGINIEKVVLEKSHPIFKRKKVDLVILGDLLNEEYIFEEDENSDILELYEFKLAKVETNKEGSDEHQRVFNDVIRLAYSHLIIGKDCYFLMCGKFSDFKAYFIGQNNKNTRNENGKNTVTPKKSKVLQNDFKVYQAEEWQSNGLYKDWFQFEVGKEKVMTFTITENKWGLYSFQQSYQFKQDDKYKFNDSITIKTICKAITPNDTESGRTHAAGIWKIEVIS